MSVPTVQVLPGAQAGVVASSPTTATAGAAFARALEDATTQRAMPRVGTDSERAAGGSAGQNVPSKPGADTGATSGTGAGRSGNAGTAGIAGTAEPVGPVGIGGEAAGAGVTGNGSAPAATGLPGFTVVEAPAADAAEAPATEAPVADGAAGLPGSAAAEDTDLADDESETGRIVDTNKTAAATHRAGDSAIAQDSAARGTTAAQGTTGAGAANAGTAHGNTVGTGTAVSDTDAAGTARGSVSGAHSPIAGAAAETGTVAVDSAGTEQHRAPEQNGQPGSATAAAASTTAMGATAVQSATTTTNETTVASATALTGPAADVGPQQVTQAAPATVFTDAISGPTAAQATEAAAGTRGAPQPQALAEQMRAPLLNLRDAGVGEHTLTLRVEPERLGPVQVRAHIGADGIRIELVGATDVGRDGLKAILTDLRRDLAAAGMNARLDVNSDPDGGFGDRNPTSDPGDRDRAGGQRTAVATPDPRAVPGHRANLTETARTSDADLRGGVDILA